MHCTFYGLHSALCFLYPALCSLLSALCYLGILNPLNFPQLPIGPQLLQPLSTTIFIFAVYIRMEKKHEEFFKRLKEELEKDKQWPGEYLFKFIVPTDTSKVEAVESAFNSMGAVIVTRKSKNENFTSISVNVHMESAQHIVDKYIEVAHIEGIISL